MICPKCGMANDGETKICKNCGAVMTEQSNMPAGSNKPVIIVIITAAIILSVLIIAIITVLLTGKKTENTPAVSTETAVPSPTITVTENVSENTAVNDDTTVKYTMYVVNCDEWISLRYAANVDSEVLATIPLGESCGFIERSENGFYKIAYNGKVGYALAQYLSTDKPNIEHKANQVPSTQIMYVVNCQESITLRPSDNINSGEITQIPLGSSVEYLGQAGNGFYKIRYNGSVGYALSQYLSSAKQQSGTAPSNVIMHVVNCKESITLRPSDNVNSGEITQIPLGSSVEYLSQAGNGFYKVRYNGAVGYALSQYLK